MNTWLVHFLARHLVKGLGWKMLQNLFKWRLFRGVAWSVLVAFVAMIPAESGYAQLVAPKIAQMVSVTPHFNPILMTGIRSDPKDPFNLFFLMNNGDNAVATDEKQAEYKKLIKYFMASLITPNSDMWVNLSPKEANRIIPDNLSMTEMGRDLLAQDYLLKQFTSSLMNPDDQLGKNFWAKLYEKAYALYGTTDIPFDTFNKVWIMADRADIYQKEDTAFLVKSHLKVMLEQDFMLAETNNEQISRMAEVGDPASAASRKMASDIVRELIIPVIEKEVNEGVNFMQVRQIYNAMILATWFKKTLKDSLLGQVYADTSKVNGIALIDPAMKERIYLQYMEAYKNGVFNYIREEIDPMTQELLPRKYFAGGMAPFDPAQINTNVSQNDAAQALITNSGSEVAAVTLATPEGKEFSAMAVKPVAQATMPATAPEALEASAASANKLSSGLKRQLDTARQATKWAYQKFTDSISRVKNLITDNNRRQASFINLSVQKTTLVMALLLASVTTSMAAPLASQGVLTDRLTGKQTVVQNFDLKGYTQVKKDVTLLIGNHYQKINAGSYIYLDFAKGHKIAGGVHPDKFGKIALQIFTLTGKIDWGGAELSGAPKSNVVGETGLKGQAVKAGDQTNVSKTALLTSRQEQLAHERIELQNQIDQVKADEVKMSAAKTAEADSDSWRADNQKKSAEDLRKAKEESALFSANFITSKGAERERTANWKKDADSPFFVSVQENYWTSFGTVRSFQLNRQGLVGNVGVVMPFGNQIQSGLMLSAGAVTPMGWLFIADTGLQEINNYSLNNNRDQTWLIDGNRNIIQSVLKTVTLDTKKVYSGDQNNVLESETTVRIGIIEAMGTTIPYALHHTPILSDVLNKLHVSKIFGSKNAAPPFVNTGYQYRYGVRELGFYQNAYRGIKGKTYMVVERAIPQDPLALAKLGQMFKAGDMKSYLNLAKKGGGYSAGITINTDGSIDYVFISPRAPSDFIDNNILIVSSNDKYKEMMAKETMVHNGLDSNNREIIAFTRDRFTHDILDFYYADNIPVQNPQEVNDPSKPSLHYTLKGAELNFQLHHKTAASDNVPVGIIIKGKTAKFYTLAELDTFRRDAFNTNTRNVVFGANYPAPTSAGWGHLFEPGTGKIIPIMGDRLPQVTEQTFTWNYATNSVELAKVGQMPQYSNEPMVVTQPVKGVRNYLFGRVAQELEDTSDRVKGLFGFQRSINLTPLPKTTLEALPPDMRWVVQNSGQRNSYAGITLASKAPATLMVTADGNVFFPGDQFEHVVKEGMSKAGVSYYFDGRPPAPAIDRNGIITIKKAIELGATNVVQRQDGTVVVANGNKKTELSLRSMVAFENGQITGIFRPSQRTMQDHLVEVDTLMDGGIEVERADGTFGIYAKGEVKEGSPQAKAGIVSQSDLVRLVAQGQVENIPVNPDQPKGVKRMRILDRPAVPILSLPYQLENTLEDFNKNNGLVIFKGNAGQEQTQWVSLEALKMASNDLLTNSAYIKEILLISHKAEANGETVGYMLKMLDSGYRPVLLGEMSDFVNKNAMLIKNDKTTGYFAIDQLENSSVRNEIRKSMYEIRIVDVNGEKAGTIFLGQQPLSSRLEKIDSTNTSSIYPLFDYENSTNGVFVLDQKHEAIGGTVTLDKELSRGLEAQHLDGEMTILKLDYQGRSASIEVYPSSIVTDVGMPLKAVYPSRVIDLVAQTVTHNDADGRELYRTRIAPENWDAVRSVAQDSTKGKPYDRSYPQQLYPEHHGLDIPLNGALVKDVLTVTHVSKTADGQVSADYIDLTDKQPGQFALIGRMVYDSDGNKSVQYTGHQRLPATIEDGNSLVRSINESDLMQKRDQFYYKEGRNGVFDHREVSERRDNGWVNTRTINGLQEVEIGKNGVDYNKLIAVDEVRAALEAQGITSSTNVLQFMPVITAEGITMFDYKHQFKTPERTVLTVYEKDGKIFKVVVATAHDPLTGIVQKAVALNQNYEINERLEYLDGNALQKAGMSNVAGDMFNDDVASRYKAVTGENLWAGLNRSGVATNSNLVIVRSTERLTDTDNRFTDQWTSGEYKVMLPDDNTGRALVTIQVHQGKMNITIVPWWTHTSLAELNSHKPLPDSAIPSPDIAPRSVFLHNNGIENQVLDFDRFTTDDRNFTGMHYQVKGAESLRGVTFYLPNGRKISEEHSKSLSMVASGVNALSPNYYSSSTRLIFDPLANAPLPATQVGPNGEIVRTFTGHSYDAEGNLTLFSQEPDTALLKQVTKKTVEFYTPLGEEHSPEIVTVHKKSIWAMLILIAGYPISVLFRAIESSKKRREAQKKIMTLPEGRLWDTDTEVLAQQLLSLKVLQGAKPRQDRNYIEMKGDPELMFLGNMVPVYTLLLSHYLRAHPGITKDKYRDLLNSKIPGPTDPMDALDQANEIMRTIGRYAAEEISRSATTLRWDRPVFDSLNVLAEIASLSAIAADGSSSRISDLSSLRAALVARLGNGPVVNALANARILELVTRMATGISELTAQEKDSGLSPKQLSGSFRIKLLRRIWEMKMFRLKKAMIKQIAADFKAKGLSDQKLTVEGKVKHKQVGKADQQVVDKLEVFMATLRDRLSFAYDADLTAGTITDGQFETVLKEMNLIDIAKRDATTTITDGVQKFYYIFQAFLKKNSFDPAPSREIRDKNGVLTYLPDANKLSEMVENRDLDREITDGYVNSLNRLSVKTVLGWGIKAIHPLLIKSAVMPRYILALLGIGVMTLGTVSPALWLATPVLGIPGIILLGGAAIVLLVGAVLEYGKIREKSELPGWLRWSLAGVALFAAGVLVAMPWTGVGILFIKAALGLPLLLEVLALTLWHHSGFGLSLYYNYRPSTDPGSLRANILQGVKYLSFMAITIGFGYFAHGWFFSQMLLGGGMSWARIAGGMWLLINTAYMTNFVAWTSVLFAASRLNPMRGTPKPSAVAKELDTKNVGKSNLLINYVGNAFVSISLLQEFVKKADDIPGVVDLWIKDLMVWVDEGAPAVLGPLKGVMKRALDVGLIRSQDFHGLTRSGRIETDDVRVFIKMYLRDWMIALYQKEFESGNSLMTDDQLLIAGGPVDGRMIPLERSIIFKTESERQRLIFAQEMNHILSLFSPFNGKINPYDAGVSLIALAYILRDTLDVDGKPLGQKVKLLFASNNGGEKNHGAIDNILKLFADISGARVEMKFVPTVIEMKGGAMASEDLLSDDYQEGLNEIAFLQEAGLELVIDRNSNSLKLRAKINDILGMLHNPEAVIMNADRTTTNTRRYMGAVNGNVENSNPLTGSGEEFTGQGWQMLQQRYNALLMRRLSNPDFPRQGFTAETRQENNRRAAMLGLPSDYANEFGVINFAKNRPEQSEDTSGMMGQTHNGQALGLTPTAAVGSNEENKLREESSFYQSLAAATRWAWGRIQMAGSFLLQRAGALGPQPLVVREGRQDTGQHYEGLLEVLAYLAMFPLSIFLGFNPFQGLFLYLSAFGIMANQASRLHGLGKLIDDSGYIYGSGRWLFYQFRDLSIHAGRFMLEALAVLVGYSGLSFLFMKSGGGGSIHEVKTWSTFMSTPFRLASPKAALLFGVVYLGLMILATASGLTIAHMVVMAIPFIWYMNLVFGQFVSESKPGVPVWGGKGDNIAAFGGAAAAVLYAGWVFVAHSAIAYLGVYIVAMVALTLLVNRFDKKGIAKRLLSQFNRYFIRTSSGALLFTLVPQSVFVKFTLLPNITKVMTFIQFTRWLGGAVIAYFSTVGLTYFYGGMMMRKVTSRYEMIRDKAWALRDRLPTKERFIIFQALKAVQLLLDRDAFKKASISLNEIDAELAAVQLQPERAVVAQEPVSETSVSVTPQPTIGTPPASGSGGAALAIALGGALLTPAGMPPVIEQVGRDLTVITQTAERMSLYAPPSFEDLDLPTPVTGDPDLLREINKEQTSALKLWNQYREARSLEDRLNRQAADATSEQPQNPLDRFKDERMRLDRLVIDQQSKLEYFIVLKQNLEAREDASDDWSKAYRKVSAQVTTTRKSLNRIKKSLGFDQDSEARDIDVVKGVASLRQRKDPESRKELAYILRKARAVTLQEFSHVIEASTVLSDDELSHIEEMNIEALVAAHPGSGDSIRFFAQLTQAQRVAALKAANAQIKVEDIILTSQAVATQERAAKALDAADSPVGGISLSDENLKLNIEVDGKGMPLPLQFQNPEMNNIHGLTPVIRSVTPVGASNMPVILELLRMAGASS